MKVLHVITGLDNGGAERQLLMLVRHLPVQCEVAVLTEAASLAPALEDAGARVHHIGMRGNRDLRAVARLARLIRRGEYDVVHTHLYRACVYGRVAARLAGARRVVATEHSLGAGHIEGRPTSTSVRLLYRATERLGRMTIAVSPTVAARLRLWGVPKSRLVLLPHGIVPDEFAFDPAKRARVRAHFGIGPDEYVIGAVGRLVATKRLDVLIHALGDRGRLLIVGEGPERAALEKLAANSGRVVFAGDTDDVPAALSAMDLFAAPSTQETFGLSVLEALASGLPVLYTACPALEDLPPSFAPRARRVSREIDAWREALAVHVTSARTDVPMAVQHYSIDTQVEALTRLYLSIP
ncbi:glycosyltransferase [Spirillospora sp. CA-294931]|uniref:glycosyltransferase n=1 Tax=Spirillospora sp. CA-294931 TaxID=3240042 RepID=UPI003D8F3642